jgi:DNA-binding LytR/AlgR family response regulator
MLTLRCFIADDEVLARERLRRLLADLPGVVVVGEAGDGVSVLEQLATCPADVLLLDIQMPELDGLAVAAELAAATAPGPDVIFVTAYDEHALAAFDVSALDYLVKPVSAERLASALARARRNRDVPGRSLAGELGALLERLGTPEPRRMAVRCGAKFIVFDPARVYAILARDSYSGILTDSGELLGDDSLDQLARRFDARQFLRVHRSAIINLAHLRELVHEGDRRYVAVLTDPAATRVPVSRDRLPALKAALGLG